MCSKPPVPGNEITDLLQCILYYHGSSFNKLKKKGSKMIHTLYNISPIMAIIRMLPLITIFAVYILIKRDREKQQQKKTDETRSYTDMSYNTDNISKSEYINTLDRIERMLKDDASKESVIDYIEKLKWYN